MKLVGLLIASIAFISIIILLLFYAYFVFSKKYRVADRIFKLFVIHSFLSFMLLTWSNIITIQSYDIGLSSSLNFSLIGIAIIFFVLTIGLLDQIHYKHIKEQYPKRFDRLIRKGGTISLMIWLSLNSYLFYLELYQFSILSLVQG